MYDLIITFHFSESDDITLVTKTFRSFDASIRYLIDFNFDVLKYHSDIFIDAPNNVKFDHDFIIKLLSIFRSDVPTIY